MSADRTLVFLPGWGMDGHKVFAPLIQSLGDQIPTRILDLPKQSSGNIYDWVETLAPQITDNTVLCGWSLGAQLAMLLARARGISIRALVLIAATPHFVQGADWPNGVAPYAFAEFAEGLMSEPLLTLKRFVALQSAGDRDHKVLTRALNHALIDPPDIQALRAGLAVLHSTDLRAEVPRIKHPTLIVQGTRDHVTPLEAGVWLKERMPRASLLTLPDCAHAPHLSRPLEVSALISAFLSRL